MNAAKIWKKRTSTTLLSSSLQGAWHFSKNEEHYNKKFSETQLMKWYGNLWYLIYDGGKFVLTK